MYFLKIFFSVYKYHVTGWFLLRYYILLNTVKHWQMLDYYLTVYFKLPLHILRPVKAEQLTICYGVHVWHILSIFHFIWTKRRSSFSTFSTKVFQLPKQFSLYNCKSNLHLGKNEEGLGQKNPFTESNLFHLGINKYCKWGIAILSSLNTMHGEETGKNQREKMHLSSMSRGKQIISGNFCL